MKNKTKFYKQALGWIKKAENSTSVSPRPVEQPQDATYTVAQPSNTFIDLSRDNNTRWSYYATRPDKLQDMVQRSYNTEENAEPPSIGAQSTQQTFQFPGLSEDQFKNKTQRIHTTGTKPKEGPISTAFHYGMPVMIGADAASTLANPQRFNWNTFGEQMRKAELWSQNNPGKALAGKAFNYGMNGFFVPVSFAEGIHHGAKGLGDLSTTPEKGIAELGLGAANLGVSASSLGHILRANPARAMRIAESAGKLGYLKPFMKLAPKMGPFMAAEMVLEGGLAERERLDRGLAVYLADQLGVTENAILKAMNNNQNSRRQLLDEDETPRSTAPATAFYTDRAVYNASKFQPVHKPGFWDVIYHNPSVLIPRPSFWFSDKPALDLGPYAARKVQKHIDGLNKGYQTLEAMKNDPALQEVLSDRIKSSDPVDESVPLGGEFQDPTGNQVVNEAVSQLYNNTPVLIGSKAGLMGDIHNMGAQPEVASKGLIQRLLEAFGNAQMMKSQVPTPY